MVQHSDVCRTGCTEWCNTQACVELDVLNVELDVLNSATL